MPGSRSSDRNWAVSAARWPARTAKALDLLKGALDCGEPPERTPDLGPHFVIPLVAAKPHGCIDAARTADNTAAWKRHGPIVEPILRHCNPSPVEVGSNV